MSRKTIKSKGKLKWELYTYIQSASAYVDGRFW